MSSIRVDLSGHVAVITGSTSGIGLHMAEGLAANGADIVLNGLGDPDVIEKERQRIAETHGVKVRYHGANMLKADEIADLIAFTARELGRLDILVNCAGIQHVAPIEDFPADKWDAIIGINLTSAFHTMKHAVPIMREQGRGRIVNIASAHALRASPFKAAYVSAKHGLMGLTKTVALETAEDGVTVNCINPGYVKTPLVENQIADTAKARGISEDEVVRDVMLSAQPTKKFVTYSELVGALLYLVSDDGANVNGNAITIDGGWTAK
ncbi:MAG: 3-hydroxybutyrate dehydrogenase [Oceanicaulis sp.]|uniref:3-hydroxybutyrate dehydrogenase n=1 Tax=Oceanicaulis sp. UBA2681 TaxID=1947007 RepID=UPI000C099A9F|nr:3-hydroxybutyrate dehydrogenase [Oceanicaulis sp. UBA2681]MAP49229.1 3-hydroxybutyrate dehydrogenase [Oceanicaulis sp.]VXC66491.1 D-beta-hydroxybutyrate dehydrogenase [Oceanicaulis sp. 350]|tara:strand:+ start:44 stop:844 length:801 start_codon:yes stop_codon:yes gene_type:complete